jgi:alpha-tubulin suppressor-like RCC1 family protein
MRSGNIKCWGYNSNGQLGTGNTTNMDTPTLASVLTNISIASGDFAVAVSAALTTTCAYFKSGLKCWGDNSNGQFGTGNVTSSLIPVPVANISGKTMAGVCCR